jgi:hypothetical protein
MRARVIAAISAVAFVTGLTPAIAIAAPAPFEWLPYSCPGYGEVRLTDPGGGVYTPGFLNGTNDLLVPYVIDVDVTGPTGTEAVVASKGAPVPDGAIICTIDATVHFGGVAYTFVGTITGLVVGQP